LGCGDTPLLKQCADINQKQNIIVNSNRFGSLSLVFGIYTFTQTTVRLEYYPVVQRVLLKSDDIILRMDNR
jgi:hypothetical protein